MVYKKNFLVIIIIQGREGRGLRIKKLFLTITQQNRNRWINLKTQSRLQSVKRLSYSSVAQWQSIRLLTEGL